jgi:K319-like protein/PKD domain-containing protein
MRTLHRHLAALAKGAMLATAALLVACDDPTMPEVDTPDTEAFIDVPLSLSVVPNSLTFTTSESPFVPGLRNQGLYGWHPYGFSIATRPESHETAVGTNGTGEFRTYYTFDLSTLTGNVVSARLVLTKGYWVGADFGVRLSEVTTDAATLSAGDPTGVSRVIFDDLGDGTAYGGSAMPYTRYNHTDTIPLNGAAVADIQAAGGGFFSIGAAPAGAPNVGQNFKLTGPYASNGVQQLIVEFNEPPVADAGADHTLEWAPDLHTTLDGSGSSDPDGQALTYEWKDSEDNVVGSSAVASVPMSGLGSSTYTLTVTDPYGQTDSDDVTVTAINLPPVADAGADQRVEWTRENAGATTLNASGSTDPNGDALTYTWSDADGDVIPDGMAPSVDLALGTHTITLTVTDPAGESDTDEVRITVEDTTAPEVTAELVPVEGRSLKHNKGRFEVRFSCSDACDSNPELTSAMLNGVAVTDGQVVDLRLKSEKSEKSDKSEKSKKSGKSDKPERFEGEAFELIVECVDESGNVGTATATAEFPEKSKKSGKSKKN